VGAVIEGRSSSERVANGDTHGRSRRFGGTLAVNVLCECPADPPLCAFGVAAFKSAASSDLTAAPDALARTATSSGVSNIEGKEPSEDTRALSTPATASFLDKLPVRLTRWCSIVQFIACLSSGSSSLAKASGCFFLANWLKGLPVNGASVELIPCLASVAVASASERGKNGRSSGD
jgi:hypothetical protein